MQLQIKEELISGEVVKKFNSLIVDVKLSNGQIVPSFCPSAEVANFCKGGTIVGLRHLDGACAKIQYEIEFVKQNGGMIFVSSPQTLSLFEEAFIAGKIKEFSEYNRIRRINTQDRLHHVDFELSNSEGKKCYVFLESVYNKKGNSAVFPTTIDFFEMDVFAELNLLKEQGARAVIFMIVPRTDCTEIKFSWSLNPVAAAKIYDEAKKGLEFICYGCKISKKSVSLAENMKILY